MMHVNYINSFNLFFIFFRCTAEKTCDRNQICDNLAQATISKSQSRIDNIANSSNQDKVKTGGGQQQEDIQDSKQLDTKDSKQLDTKDIKQLNTNNIKQLDTKDTKQLDTNNIKQLDTKDIKHSNDAQTKKVDNVTGDMNNDSHNCVDSIGGTPTGHKIFTETSLVEESQTKDGEQAETESNTNASKGIKIDFQTSMIVLRIR